MKEQSLIIDLNHMSEYIIQEHLDWIEIPIILDDKYELTDVKENIEVAVKVSAMIMAKVIDDYVKYDSHIADISFGGTSNLTKAGETALIDDTIMTELDPFILPLYDFLDQSEWDTYELKLVHKTLYITKGMDWRAYQYMKLNDSDDLTSIE